MSWPASLHDGNISGYSTPPDVLANDPEGLRDVICRNRYRLVYNERRKRDRAKMLKQLKEKFGPTWPVVAEFLGSVTFEPRW